MNCCRFRGRAVTLVSVAAAVIALKANGNVKQLSPDSFSTFQIENLFLGLSFTTTSTKNKLYSVLRKRRLDRKFSFCFFDILTVFCNICPNHYQVLKSASNTSNICHGGISEGHFISPILSPTNNSACRHGIRACRVYGCAVFRAYVDYPHSPSFGYM